MSGTSITLAADTIKSAATAYFAAFNAHRYRVMASTATEICKNENRELPRLTKVILRIEMGKRPPTLRGMSATEIKDMINLDIDKLINEGLFIGCNTRMLLRVNRAVVKFSTPEYIRVTQLYDMAIAAMHFCRSGARLVTLSAEDFALLREQLIEQMATNGD